MHSIRHILSTASTSSQSTQIFTANSAMPFFFYHIHHTHIPRNMWGFKLGSLKWITSLSSWEIPYGILAESVCVGFPDTEDVVELRADTKRCTLSLATYLHLFQLCCSSGPTLSLFIYVFKEGRFTFCQHSTLHCSSRSTQLEVCDVAEWGRWDAALWPSHQHRALHTLC